MSDENKSFLRGLPSGFRDRTLVTAKLAGKLGASFVRASLGVAGGSDGEAGAESAGELFEQLGKLKGLVMKLGQMASYLPGSMPPEAQRVLARLQSDSHPLAWAEVKAALERELGAPPQALFDRIDKAPFAAASIGQVHRATAGGRELAVKVQYPGVEEVIRSDLRTVGVITRLSTVGMPIDAGALTDELSARLIEECDYRIEARSQRAFARLLEGDDRCLVPAVDEARSARRVLSTELAPGLPFYRFADQASQADKDRAAATIFDVCFTCLFGRCVYNADPHPGNYLFEPGGRVVFLDFGCVRRFDPAMIDTWKAFARSVLAGDRRGFREHFVALGLAPAKGRFDWDHQWEMTRYLYQPFTSTEPFTYTDDYVRRSYDLMIFKNPNRMRQQMPPEWLFLNRLQWGMNSLLAHLGATADWPTLWRTAVESKTLPASMDEPATG